MAITHTTHRRRMAALTSAALLVAMLSAACGDDTDTTGGSSVDETTPSSTSSTSPPQRTGQAEVAIADLAERLGVDPSVITLVSVDAVTWRDSSLGCPQRGFQYLQVLTEGVRIVLEVDGTTYRYHSGGTGDPFYCATPEAPYSIG